MAAQQRPGGPPGHNEGGPPAKGNRLHLTTPLPTGREATSIVVRGAVSERQRDAVLALSDERDLWLARVYRAWREGYQAALSDAVVESLLRLFPAPGHVTEIDKRRYGPGGREHFADPRPGDCPGGPVEWTGGSR